MQNIAQRTVVKDNSKCEIVEITLWEAYLLYNRGTLNSTLSVYSLDNGPFQKANHENGKVTFRFMAYDWERTLKQLLNENQIPVRIKREYTMPSLVY